MMESSHFIPFYEKLTFQKFYLKAGDTNFFLCLKFLKPSIRIHYWILFLTACPPNFCQNGGICNAGQSQQVNCK